jgi:DNA-binding transcriptional LysR family regulator
MELRHLRYLVAVVDEGGFTRAAQALHVAQPGISSQLKQLERELGQQLLERSAQGVRLTAAGKAVLPYARAALSAADGVRQTIDQLTGLLNGDLAVGTVASFAAPRFGLPRLMADFHLAHPGVTMSLTEAPAATLLDGLRSGRLDLAFAGDGTVPEQRFAVEPVWSDEIAATGLDLPPVVRLEELAGRTGGVAVLPASATGETVPFDPLPRSRIVIAAVGVHHRGRR